MCTHTNTPDMFPLGERFHLKELRFIVREGDWLEPTIPSEGHRHQPQAESRARTRLFEAGIGVGQVSMTRC